MLITYTNIRRVVMTIQRGSCMSAHVLLTLLNELSKRDKLQGLPSVLSLFHTEFNKFNNTGARMLDSIYHITVKILNNYMFGVKTSKLSLTLHVLRNVVMDVITFPEICKPLVVYQFYCMTLYQSQTRRHVINYTIIEYFTDKNLV